MYYVRFEEFARLAARGEEFHLAFRQMKRYCNAPHARIHTTPYQKALLAACQKGLDNLVPEAPNLQIVNRKLSIVNPMAVWTHANACLPTTLVTANHCTPHGGGAGCIRDTRAAGGRFRRAG